MKKINSKFVKVALGILLFIIFLFSIFILISKKTNLFYKIRPPINPYDYPALPGDPHYTPVPSITNSIGTVILKLPAKNDKTLEYKEKIESGDNVFLLLKRVADRENIHFAYKYNDDFLYVYQIGQVGGLTMDCGFELLINNKEVLQSPDKYFLKAGDKIQWLFKCEDK